MTHLEHFIYGLFNGEGIKLLKTGKVSDLLTADSFKALRKLKESQVNWLPTEQIVAVTHVHEVTDEYDRSGLYNHTILIPIQDYLRLATLDMDSYFMVQQRLDNSHQLKPIKVEV